MFKGTKGRGTGFGPPLPRRTNAADREYEACQAAQLRRIESVEERRSREEVERRARDLRETALSACEKTLCGVETACDNLEAGGDKWSYRLREALHRSKATWLPAMGRAIDDVVAAYASADKADREGVAPATLRAVERAGIRALNEVNRLVKIAASCAVPPPGVAEIYKQSRKLRLALDNVAYYAKAAEKQRGAEPAATEGAPSKRAQRIPKPATPVQAQAATAQTAPSQAGPGQSSVSAPAPAPAQAPAPAPAPHQARPGINVAVLDQERLDAIAVRVSGTWAGPWVEAELVELWAGFGPRMLAIAAQHPELWAKSLDVGARLDELPEIAQMAATFRADVRALADRTMGRNEAHVQAEMQALGITEDGRVAPEQSVIPKVAQDEYATDLQILAHELVSARIALDELSKLTVGYNTEAGQYGFSWQPARFDPRRAPSFLSSYEGVPEHLRTRHPVACSWENAKKHHDALQAVIAHVANQSPALYAMASSDDVGALADVATTGPTQALEVMADQLSALLARIRETRDKLGGDLDERDLSALHQRLFEGEASASGTDWSRSVEASVARHMLADHKSGEFWLDLGLGTLAAAGFLIAEFATFGTASVFIAAGVGLGASGALAARGWEQWDDLSTAARSSADRTGHVVTQGQADAALVAAVVDSAFVFLDLVPLTKPLRSGALARRGTGETSTKVAEDTAERASAEAAENTAERTSAEAAEDTAERTSAEAAEDTAERTSAEAAENTAAKPRRLRPNQAANWPELQRGFLGRKLADVGSPTGYSVHIINGRTILRRASADDARWARLHVGPDGIIHAGPAPVERISNSMQVAANVERMLVAHGLSVRPPGHQAHHLIPNEVVRKHPLVRQAYERGLFDPDALENLQLLAMKRYEGAIPAKVPGLSEGLPRHQGAHPAYTRQVTLRANALIHEITTDASTLAELKDAVLLKAIENLQSKVRSLLEGWPQPHLD